MRILAVKSKGYLVSSIITSILGAITIVASVILIIYFGDTTDAGYSFIMTLFGTGILVGGIVFGILYAKLPKILITFDDDYFHIYDGFDIEISKVVYAEGIGYRCKYGRYTYGVLHIHTTQGEYTVSQVADVSEVAGHICHMAHYAKERKKQK